MTGKYSFVLAILLGVLISACAGSTTVASDETAMIVCHDNRRTLTLPEDEAVKHLDHGDNIGACAGK